MTNTQQNHSLIEECIIRYPRLFEPRLIQDSGSPVYSAKLYMEKDYAEELSNLVFNVAQGAFEKDKYNHPSFHWPLNPASSNLGDSKNERLKHLYVINAKANQDFKPKVVDIHGNDLPQHEIYSGCIVAAVVRFYPWEKFGKHGVGSGLIGIMKLSDGTPIEDGSYDPAVLFHGLDISKYETEDPTIEKPSWFTNAGDTN